MSTEHRTHDQGVPPPTPHEARYLAVQRSPEFQDLRRRYRGWVFPVAAVSIAWYFLYVFLSTYAPDFMGTKVFGNINIGLILGLAQFVTTFGVTQAYVAYADKQLDPRSAKIRQDMEKEGLA